MRAHTNTLMWLVFIAALSTIRICFYNVVVHNNSVIWEVIVSIFGNKLGKKVKTEKIL